MYAYEASKLIDKVITFGTENGFPWISCTNLLYPTALLFASTGGLFLIIIQQAKHGGVYLTL